MLLSCSDYSLYLMRKLVVAGHDVLETNSNILDDPLHFTELLILSSQLVLDALHSGCH